MNVLDLNGCNLQDSQQFSYSSAQHRFSFNGIAPTGSFAEHKIQFYGDHFTLDRTGVLFPGTLRGKNHRTRRDHKLGYCREYEDVIYRVAYTIQTNAKWETLSVHLESRDNERVQRLDLESNGAGRWTNSGKTAAAFGGCIDADLPLTPFTNTLPINRLRLQPGEERTIQVLYLDILAGQLYPVRQKYSCLAPGSYHYENIPNDFEADITVDPYGFVVDYPGLFTRTAMRQQPG